MQTKQSKKDWLFSYVFCWVMILLLLLGCAQVIRFFGGDKDLMLWMLTALCCGSFASDFAKDNSETPK